MFHKDTALKILNIAVLLQQQRYMVAIVFLFYLQNGLSLSDFLLFQSIFYFTGLLTEIPAGYIGDIFPRKYVLIFSYMLFAIRIIMWIIAPNYLTILLGEILYGLSKSFYKGVSDGYIYDYLKEYKTESLMLNKYGKFNFFMSLGSALSCLIGASLYKYLGFKMLLFIELFFNSTAIIILFFLPNIKQKRIHQSPRKHFSKMYNAIVSTFKDNRMNIYLLYTGILFGTTSIFVWNFQPFMKNFALPAFLFGAIYFINHILRALGSIGASKFLEKIPLEKTGLVVWILYMSCFLFAITVMNNNSKYLCVICLIFICVAIGIQMIFNIGNLTRIHNLISSDTRATISSISSMLCSLFSGIFLMIYKHLLDSHSILFALCIFAFSFMFSILLARKIYIKN